MQINMEEEDCANNSDHLCDHDYTAGPVGPLADHDYVSNVAHDPGVPDPAVPTVSVKDVRKRAAEETPDEPLKKKCRPVLSDVIKEILLSHNKLSLNEILKQLQCKYPEIFR